MSKNSQKYLKILFINPFGIGDVLFTTAAIKAIRDEYPDAVVGYWCNERVKDLLDCTPGINKIFALSRGDFKKQFARSKFHSVRTFMRMLHAIKKEKFDVVLDFSLDHRYGFITWLQGIKRRIGFNYKNRGFLLTDKIPLEGYRGRHMVEYYLELVQQLGIPLHDPQMLSLCSPSSTAKGQELLKKQGIQLREKIIGICPAAGESWGAQAASKHWPAKRFAELADRIIDEFHAKIVIIGGAAEQQIADEVLSSMSNAAVNLTGKTSLQELAAVISNLSLLVTNDGGPLHVAVSCGIKTVSIFGPVDEVVYGPYPRTEKHAVITKDIECRPCYRNFKTADCLRNRECITSITLEEVLTAIRRIW